MEIAIENKLYGPVGQSIGKSQLYTLLVDTAGNPILDGSGNRQVVATQSSNGRMQVDAIPRGDDSQILVNTLLATPIGVVLAANATFTSPVIDRPMQDLPVGRTRVWADSDVSGTLYLEETDDATNGPWIPAVPINSPTTATVSAGVHAIIDWTKFVKRYARIRYVNGATPQTAFILLQYFQGVTVEPVSIDGVVPVAGALPVTVVGSLANLPTVTIANGASLSGVVDLAQQNTIGLSIPSAWTAASITFAVSVDNVTFNPLYYQGVEFTLSEAGASRQITIDPTALLPWRYVKVRSGTNSTPVNQGQSAIITLLTKSIA